MPKHPRAAALFLASILLVGSASAAYAQYYSSSSRNNDDRRAAQERERREQAERERRKRAEQERRERERQQQAQRERQQREQAERQRRERAEHERRAREQQAQRERQKRAAQERQQREIAERTQRARQQELERQRQASQQRAQQSSAARQPQPSMTPTGVIRDGKYERYTPPTSSAPATLAPSHPRNQHPGTMRERPVPANNQQAPRTMTTPTPPRPFPENNPTVRLTPSGAVPARPANTPAGTGMIAAPSTPSRTVASAPIASSGGNANCVSYREEGRGSHCGKPGSYHVRVTNNCASAQKARVCYTREDGSWSCYANLSVASGRSESIGFACNAGQYRVSWADARSGTLESPPAARPGGTPAPAPAPSSGKTGDDKAPQKEALAFCWQTQSGNWMCDGKTQRLLTSYKDVNAALGLVGCKNPRRQIPWSGGGKSGTLYYCGYNFKYKPSTSCKDDSWERDIRPCYGVRD